MTQKDKILNLLKLKQAHDKGESVFELGRRLDDLSEKIDRFSGNKETKDETIEVELEIT